VRKHGLGVAGTTWDGSGLPGPEVEVTIGTGGEVTVICGTQDIGTGTRTILAQVVAEELGISAAEVTVRLGDSYFPYSILSGGSLTAASVTPAARSAAAKARNDLLHFALKDLGEKVANLMCAAHEVRVRGSDRSLSWGDMARDTPSGMLIYKAERQGNYAGFEPAAAGCQFAEVAVDTDTGEVRVVKVVAVHDSGRILNPLLWESQVNGGVIQGISFALLEQRVIDHRYGTVLNADMETYKVLGALEVPEIEIIPFPVAAGFNNTQVIGIGEPAIIPTAAAVANAVANALGVRIADLPITPDKVLNALESQAKRRG
jgi:xanthine dehydrogenase YagR molybdenum-binding subunit